SLRIRTAHAESGAARRGSPRGRRAVALDSPGRATRPDAIEFALHHAQEDAMIMPEAGELLAPISEDAPCGEDMAFSLEYDRIQEARRGDDPTLDQGEWVTDLKVADWAAVHRDTTTLLTGRTKDLQLAVWFAEASVRLHGFSGLARGYRVVAGLCEQYWGDMYPQDRDDEHEQRIGNFSWL